MHWNSPVIAEQSKLLEDLKVLRAVRKQISVSTSWEGSSTTLGVSAASGNLSA